MRSAFARTLACSPLFMLAVYVPVTLGQMPIASVVQQEPPPVVVPVAVKKKEKTALLPAANRQAIWRRLNEVRDEIEKTESEMFSLSKPVNGSLVASRDRWHNELQRIQADIRLTEKDLAEAETKKVEMEKREKELRDASNAQLASDKPLQTLKAKLAMYELRKKNLRSEMDARNLRENQVMTMEDSLDAEINDTQMEVAQREESLRTSYKGGQADQILKELADLQSNAEAKRTAKEVLLKRFAEIESLSEDITKYARLERRVEMLQILHRKLAELNAQQEVEYLKSIDPNKQKVDLAVK